MLYRHCFSFPLGYATSMVQENQDGFKVNSIHQLLVYADDANILGGSVHATKKKTVASVVASKEIGLEVNAEKTKYKSRSGLLWVITQRVMVIVWVRIYHYSLRNDPEERSSQLLRGGSLKSHISTRSCLKIRMQDKNHNTRINNSSSERAEQLKYLETILTNQNSIQEEYRRRMKAGNACYHSVQNLLSSSFFY